MMNDAEDRRMRVYEVGYHLVPTIAEGELEGAVAPLRAAIEKAGGSFIAEGALALVKLAYPVAYRSSGKRMEHDRGYFGWIKFEADTSAAQNVEQAFAGNAHVLRSMVFKTVREDTRAKFRTAPLREVKRTDTLKAAPRREHEAAAPVSEEDLDKAIEILTLE